MEQFFGLLGKDALTNLCSGLSGGALGVLIRISLRFEDEDPTNDKIKRSDLLGFIAWTLFGGGLGINLKIDSTAVFLLGIFAPIVYKLLEKAVPKALSIFELWNGKGKS